MRRITLLLGIAGFAFGLPGFAQRKAVERRGTPGEFDYYVLSLAWSPQYCAGPSASRDAAQCGEGRQFGFVAHGLWPQYERGYPQFCAPASKVPPATIRRMLPLMPSDKLIQHEWNKHGTCSGLSPADYFRTIEKLFTGIKIPAEYKAPVAEVYVNRNVIRKKFLAANPGFSGDSVRVLCGGRYLSEVRICLSKNLKPRPCSAAVRDTCRAGEIIMQPVR